MSVTTPSTGNEGSHAIGDTPPRVMAQMGHTSPQLALAIYAKEMDRQDGEPDRLPALVGGASRA